MKRIIIFLTSLIFISGTFIRAESDELHLEFTHEYYWAEFTVTKDQPDSDNGRYILVEVEKNGHVKLFDRAVSDIEAKPLTIKKLNKDLEEVENIYVVQSSWKNQSATIRELRMKTAQPVAGGDATR